MTRVLGVLLALLLALALSSLSLAFAQGVYIGAGVSRAAALDETVSISPQLGINLAPSIGVRALVDTNLRLTSFGRASADALFNLALPFTTLYVGAGADAFFADGRLEFTATTVYGAHALAGAELRLGPLGAFGEVQPGITLDGSSRYFRARAGVNLHF